MADSCDEADGGQEVVGEMIVSCCDPAEVLDASELALDGVAVAVEGGREVVLPASIGLWRDIRRDALALDLAADGVTVIPLVAMQGRRLGHLVEQGVGGNTARDLAASQQERDQTAEAIGERVELRGAPAARTADRLGEFPPLSPEG